MRKSPVVTAHSDFTIFNVPFCMLVVPIHSFPAVPVVRDKPSVNGRRGNAAGYFVWDQGNNISDPDISSQDFIDGAGGIRYLRFAGVDARAYFKVGKNDNAKIIFQVKSGGVNRKDIATLRGDMTREDAALAILITLEEPSGPMIKEAKEAGQFNHVDMGHNYDRISIVTIRQIVEENKHLEIPMSLEVLAAAKLADSSEQISLL